MGKVYNINAMRPALIAAHKDNNKKALTKDQATGAGVGIDYFNQWVQDVNALRETIYDYVTKKHDPSADKAVVNTAREQIFPKWKTILEAGEKSKTTKELRVSEFDVDSLVGYAEKFMATGAGTQIAGTTQQIFRKYVESLLGVRIAQNTVLSDEDRDILDAYYKAARRIGQLTDQIAELKQTKSNFKKMITDQTSDDFKGYLNRMIKQVDEQIKTANESKDKADAERAKVATKAKAIEAALKVAKL